LGRLESRGREEKSEGEGGRGDDDCRVTGSKQGKTCGAGSRDYDFQCVP